LLRYLLLALSLSDAPVTRSMLTSPHPP